MPIALWICLALIPDEIIGIKRTRDLCESKAIANKRLNCCRGELQNLKFRCENEMARCFGTLPRPNAADGYMEGVIADISDRKQKPLYKPQRQSYESLRQFPIRCLY